VPISLSYTTHLTARGCAWLGGRAVPHPAAAGCAASAAHWTPPKKTRVAVAAGAVGARAERERRAGAVRLRRGAVAGDEKNTGAR
jgi:hypothetical protein